MVSRVKVVPKEEQNIVYMDPKKVNEALERFNATKKLIEMANEKMK